MNGLSTLPIDAYVPGLLASLEKGRDVVLVAEPGAGKTTRVPPAIVESGLLGKQKLVMLQPRRVAARAAAARIGEEQGWQLGREVGYQVRFERVMERDTPLRVITEGILVRQLVGDPSLEGIGCVVLDEFHERSIHSDLSLAMLREAKSALREDLRLVVMSATLDADEVATYLRETGNVDILHVPGRLFPVEVEYAGDRHDAIEDRVRDALEPYFHSTASPRDAGPEARSEGQSASRSDVTAGDVLVFLPGVREIEWTMSRIEGLAGRHGYDVLPLHGSLDKEEQDRAVRYDPKARPRVICATNIAETSLTLPGVRLVIDSGLVRQAGYDADRGVETLETTRISRASADQRAGRAGRVAAGRCIRLWSAMSHRRLPQFDIPEILRVDLCEASLAVRAWGGDPGSFPWFEAPDPKLLASATGLLEGIGAVENGRLTPLGRRLEQLPLHPRPARLLTAAPRHLAREALLAASLLGEGAELPGRRCATIHELIEAFERRKLDPATGHAVTRAARQLERFAGDGQAADVDSLEELLLLAYPDRVCRRRSPDTATLVEGGGVRLPEASVLRGDWFLALDLRRGTFAQKQQADIKLIAPIEVEWLAKHFPRQVVRQETAEWDDARERPVAVRRVRYHDLILEEQRGGPPDPAAAAELLRLRLLSNADNFLATDEQANNLMHRVNVLQRALPSHLRPVDAAEFEVDQIVEDAISGATSAGAFSADDVRRRLGDALRSRLWASAWHRLLEEHAPESIEVPTGSRIKLDWSQADPTAPRGPVMSVRLQELFGLPETPRVCGGTIPVTLHLLGPNYRPVQVTSDLASFWKNTYPQVRKDLRARYPKHSWPEDPLTAPAMRGPRRRGTSN